MSHEWGSYRAAQNRRTAELDELLDNLGAAFAVLAEQGKRARLEHVAAEAVTYVTHRLRSLAVDFEQIADRLTSVDDLLEQLRNANAQTTPATGEDTSR